MELAKKLFSESQRELLTAVLNRIIPAGGQFPAAGDLGLADFIERATGQKGQLRRLFVQGLAEIDITAMREAGKEFLDLADEARDATLRSVESRSPVFFSELVRQTYNGYYTSPRILSLIGYVPPALQPEGYRPEVLDPALLAKQRQRAPFWTQT